MSVSLRGLIAAVLVTGLVASGIPTTPVVADRHEETAEPGLYVVLDTDGDATVEQRSTYNLTDDEQRTTFERIESNDDAKQNLSEKYHQRMQSVADEAAAETGRWMVVAEPTSRVYVADNGSTGVVELSVKWSGFAGVGDDGTLVVTEPFRSGLISNERVVIVPPEGHSVAGTSPMPDEIGEQLVWHADTDKSGFKVQFAPSEVGGVSVGIIAALAAIVIGFGGIAVRKRL